MKKVLVLFLLWIGFPLIKAYAQIKAIDVPIYEVISLPRKAGYAKDQLNKDISSLQQDQVVRNLLKRKFQTIKDLKIDLWVTKKDGVKKIWTINLGSTKKDTWSDLVMISKGNALSSVYELNDLRRGFRDSLIVIDSLNIGYRISDDRYFSGGYYLNLSTPSNKQAINQPINFINQSLVLKANNVKTDIWYRSLLMNSSRGDEVMAAGHLFFLGAANKNDCITLVNYLRSKGLNEKELTDQLLAYITVNFGAIEFYHLRSWIRGLPKAN